MTRRINDAGLALVKKDEGLELRAYRDVAGVCTIGYGHTGRDVHPGQCISEAKAAELLRADLAHAEAAVDGSTHDVPTTDGQFSAMASLAFNIGTGAFRGSTVLRKHRAGDHAGAAAAFLQWDKAHVGGQLQIVPGLLRRRSEERALYLSASDVKPRPVAVRTPQKRVDSESISTQGFFARISSSVARLLPLLFLAICLSGCAAALPIALATAPLWEPAIEAAAKGVVEGIEVPKPASTP